MALNFEQKKAVVDQVSGMAKNAHSLVAAEYRGLSVYEMTQFRDKAKEAGVHVQVIPNTLARRAFIDTEFECVNDHLVGPLVLAFSCDDPGSAARVVKDYAKKNDKLVTRLAAFNGQLFEASQLDVIADLPTREEALAQLVGCISAPISKLVRTLAEPHARVVRVLAKKGESA